MLGELFLQEATKELRNDNAGVSDQFRIAAKLHTLTLAIIGVGYIFAEWAATRGEYKK